MPYGFAMEQVTLAGVLPVRVPLKPEHPGRLVFPDVTLEAGPEMFQRSLFSRVPLMLSPASHAAHGWALWAFTMALISQPSSNWPNPLIPGMS